MIRISSGQKLDGAGWSVFARKGFLAEWRKGRQVASIDLRAMAGLPGAHNHQNACAAYAACRAPRAGAEARSRRRWPASPACRIAASWSASGAGVRFVNDSKATNVDSAAKALQAFARIRWIAGGLGKEGGIAALRPLSRVGGEGLSDRPFGARLRAAAGRDRRTRSARRWSVPWPAPRPRPSRARSCCWPRLPPASTSMPNFEKRGEDFTARVKALIG